jgi:hypothetical protein
MGQADGVLMREIFTESHFQNDSILPKKKKESKSAHFFLFFAIPNA